MKRYLLLLNCVLFGLAVRSQSLYTCRYWFDQGQEYMETVTANNNILEMELDVGNLTAGMHLLYIQVKDTTDIWCSPEHYIFYKASTEEPINTDNLVYHCWFDQDVAHIQSGPFGTGQFMLNTDDLEVGLHLLYITLEGNSLTSAENYLFFKTSTAEPIDIDNLVYRCWFDQDYSTMQTGLFGNGIFELDTESLSGGIHTLYVQLDNNASTAPQCYLFYKKPEKQHIARWEYWLNDNINQRHTTNLSPCVDSLSIISLLPVENCPIRSSCFHFHPNGDEPYISAKNKITFRFWDTECHCIDKSALYIDEHVQEPVLADSLIRDTTVCITAPRDNQIHWFKVPLQVGDSIAFMTDKACTMQLFAPSGEEVFNAVGPESVIFGGIHAWEDGNYYLAVHDVTGSGEEICLTNVYVHRYAILVYDVHLVGNGGCSTITFQGNGFNSLLDAYLVNYQNDTIRRLDIGHESNTTTTVTFDFYQKNLGTYDAVFQFYGETIRVNGALEVQEPVDILLTSSVSYPSQFLRNTPCTYTYTITNNGNMTAYAVPIYVYLSTSTMNGVSLIEFDGLKLQSLIDGVDLDSLSPSRIEELKEISDVIGDIHHFFIHKTIDEVTGDSIIARSNFFFLDLAPFETKTLTLKITANESLDVWMTVPNEIVPPLTLHSDRGDWFGSPWCCVKDNWTCAVNTICEVINIINLLSSFFPANPVQEISGIASCICGFLSTGMSIFTAWKCHGEGNFVGMASDVVNSISGTVASCVGRLIPTVDAEGAVIVKGLVENIIASLTSAISGGVSLDGCFVEQKKKPNCPDGDDNGGKSEAVNSLDPNDIYGYLSESGSHYMRQEIQNMQYEIEFENDSTLATAAAHTIIVRDTLDATKFDLNSLAARSVTIGDKRLDLNGEQTFARTLDLRPEIYVIAQINQDYDPTTGIIQWTIQSLDPMTMEPTNDPNQGVLPVNYYGDGVGFIDYSVNLREAFADGTEISNRAGIIFDQEDQILTPTWTNIVDAVKPASQIESVEVVSDSLSFNFVSSDNRSGVWYHSLYYRNASTEQEWLVKKAQIFEDSFMLPFDSLQTTEYFVMAVDSAGNVEAMKTEAEVVVESSFSGFPLFVAGYGESTNAGWRFIASPVAGSIAATMVDSIFSATQYDLYYFDQGEESEWRNYKSNSFNLTNGQGYLYATKEDKTLIFRGAYNEADAYEVPLVYTGVNPHTDMRGWNLIGNPFTVPAYVDRSYYTMNEEGPAIEPVAVSDGSPIPACHGVMVKAETSGEKVTFSRTAQQNASNQGNIQIAVTQATSRGNTTHDKAIVSFNSSDQLGKFNFNESNAKVYIPQDGKDYAIAYAAKTGEIPVNFKAAKSGSYTVNVNADGLEFNYLHLIDNLTGADVDLLTELSYTFEAKTTDYASRFRLVFSVCGDADGDNAPFAFINNGNIIIIGAEAGATLQVVDVLGRVLVCKDVSHVSTISTNGMASGVYVLRLINSDDVKTQKIVVK